ncbi:Mut7-C RNAse domain-containing protein [Burkholderia alba]|uniref:Mut7-C RNAse domain-containing protein n=1 Tax=Burkholderia alba TaxID=2683677 RepID=UPI002B0543EF|nr:Mut7-C RNAse domain-containing protein [Burkholderia alba]
MVIVTFRFYEELNDFLARALRRREFERTCAPDATVKHAIEALGVPHTEVELILVNGESSSFGRVLASGDRVAVYPRFETFDIQPLLRVRAAPLRVTRFIADAHLGGLAQLLRLAGFDTLYDNHYPDALIETIAARDARIVLTRDRELLKRGSITHGCYVRELKPEAQLRALFARLDLARSAQPFRLCLACNAPLRRIEPSDAIGRAPPGVLQRHTRFVTCDVCRRVFWEGTHWRRMRALLDSLSAPPHTPS